MGQNWGAELGSPGPPAHTVSSGTQGAWGGAQASSQVPTGTVEVLVGSGCHILPMVPMVSGDAELSAQQCGQGRPGGSGCHILPSSVDRTQRCGQGRPGGFWLFNRRAEKKAWVFKGERGNFWGHRPLYEPARAAPATASHGPAQSQSRPPPGQPGSGITAGDPAGPACCSAPLGWEGMAGSNDLGLGAPQLFSGVWEATHPLPSCPSPCSPWDRALSCQHGGLAAARAGQSRALDPAGHSSEVDRGACPRMGDSCSRVGPPLPAPPHPHYPGLHAEGEVQWIQPVPKGALSLQEVCAPQGEGWGPTQPPAALPGLCAPHEFTLLGRGYPLATGPGAAAGSGLTTLPCSLGCQAGWVRRPAQWMRGAGQPPTVVPGRLKEEAAVVSGGQESRLGLGVQTASGGLRRVSRRSGGRGPLGNHSRSWLLRNWPAASSCSTPS